MNKVKLVILTISISFVLGSTSLAQQVSLFDRDGEARAYIDFEEDATIFLWDGTPVAFLENDGGDVAVIGFNGRFLGWYEDGVIYDKNGYAVGGREGAINMMTKMEKMKSMKKMIPLRPITPMTPMRPLRRNSWSSTSLSEFLFFGKK